MSFKKVLLSSICAVFAATASASASSEEDIMAAVEAYAAELNAKAAEAGLSVIVEYVELITAQDEAGLTVYFNDRGNKQLLADFVPGDLRRSWNASYGLGANAISYIKESHVAFEPNGVSLPAANDAIDDAMATWNGQNCSKGLDIVDLGAVPLPGLGTADLMHWGWVPDAVLPYPIIGATYTYIWVDGSGSPTDIDGNGLSDVALRYIIYSNGFTWSVDGSGADIDVESIALHEAGHGLSQAHFGRLSRTDKNGKFHFSPRAVMNAGYVGPARELAGTDNGGHCSNWANWPNN